MPPEARRGPGEAGGRGPGGAGGPPEGGRVLEATPGRGARARGRGLAPQGDQGPRERDLPRGPVVPLEPDRRLPALRARLHHPRPPQALLLRRHGGGPGPRTGALQRHRRRLRVRGADLGRPGAPGLRPRAPPAQGRGAPPAALAGVRRERDPGAAPRAAAPRGLRGARGRARGVGVRRPRTERPQRGGLRATRRRPSPRPSCTRSRRRTPSSSPPTRCGRARSGPASWRARRCAAATSTSWPPRSTTPRPPGRPILARTREIFARLLEVRRIMAGEIAALGRPPARRRLHAGRPLRRHARARSARRRTASGSTRSSRTSSRCRRTRPGCSTEVAAELEADGYKPRFIAEGTREGRPKMHRKTQLFVTRRGPPRATRTSRRSVESLRGQLGARARVTANPVSVFEQESPLETERPILERMRKEPAARDGEGGLLPDGGIEEPGPPQRLPRRRDGVRRGRPVVARRATATSCC